MDTVYYVFNFSGKNGFVIVAADERAYPILGYSFNGNYTIDNQPPAFSAWMECRKKEISFIFNKFYRLEGSQAGGTGLGLSIVKGFVEALKGTVTVENRKNGGAIFTIKIPTETPEIDKIIL